MLFHENETSRVVEIEILEDDIDEEDEFFFLRLKPQDPNQTYIYSNTSSNIVKRANINLSLGGAKVTIGMLNYAIHSHCFIVAILIANDKVMNLLININAWFQQHLAKNR